MNKVAEEILAKSKYDLPKAVEYRLRIQGVRADLADLQYKCVLLNKSLEDLQTEYRKFLNLNEKGEFDENAK